ncbi:hypothetical protein Bbelb_215790 [Branchiostoma belcheri]|nr:hypothetical protein Bbelb_215790 [Branchiostoma belcheri]
MVDAPLQHGFSASCNRRSSQQSNSSIQRLSFSLSHRRISRMSAGEGEGLSRQGSTMSARGGNMRGFGTRTSITSDLGALMEIDGNQGQGEIEHEIREQLRGPLEDISRQRLRAMRMALRRYGNVDSRISQKDLLTVFQEHGLKISSRLLAHMLHRYENQFGIDYENMWKLMYDTQHTTGRDSVMAKNASNENSNSDQLNQSFHNSADLKLVERIKTQFAKSGDEFDLEEFRDELKVRDRGHTTTLSKKELKKAVAEMQIPIYGNVMNALMKRCDDECNGQISWPEFLRFLTAAKDSLLRGEDGTDLNASGSKLWNTGTASTRTSTGDDTKGNQNSNFRLATRPGDFPLLACFRSTQFECLTDGTDMEDRVKRVFKDVWGFEVRPDQLKAVLAALGGKDVFVGMATGKGKSLCFQSIPLCLTEPKLVVVVSPLRALVHYPSFQRHGLQLGAEKMSTMSSGPRLIEGTPYSDSPRPQTPQSLALKRNSMPTPKSSSVSPRKARSMVSDTLRGYDGSSSGTEDSRKRRGSPIAEETHRPKSPDSQSALTEPKPPPAPQPTTPAPAPEESPKTSPPPDQSTAQRKDDKPAAKTVPSKEKKQPAPPSTAPVQTTPPPKEEPPTPPVNVPTPSPAPNPPQEPPPPTTTPPPSDKPSSEPNGILPGKPPLPENSTETKTPKENGQKPSQQRKISPPSRENTMDKDPPQKRPTKSAISRKSVHIVEKRESSASVVKRLPPKSAPPKRSTTEGNLRRVSSQATKTQPSKSTVDLRKNSPSPKESPPTPGEATPVPTQPPSQTPTPTPIPHIPSANSLTSMVSHSGGSDLEASMHTSASNNSLASLMSKKGGNSSPDVSDNDQASSPTRSSRLVRMGKAVAMAEKARSGHGARSLFSPASSAAGKAVVFADGTKLSDGGKSPQSGRKISMATARKAAMFGQRTPSREGMSDSETEASDQALPSLNAGRRVMAFVGSAKQKRQDRSPSPGERSQSPKSRGIQSAGRRAMMLAGKGRGGSAQETISDSEDASGLTNKQKIKLAQKAMALSPVKGERPKSPWLTKVQTNASEGKDSKESEEGSGKKSPRLGTMKKMQIMGKVKNVGKESLDSKAAESEEENQGSGKKSPKLGTMKKMQIMGKVKNVGKESLDSKEGQEENQESGKKVLD